MSLTKFLKARKTASNPASISLRNIWAVIQAFFRKHTRNIGGLAIPDHVYEQIIWRRIQVRTKSPMCWEGGSCIVCGCDILGKTMEDRGCSISEHPELLTRKSPCYPAMMTKEKWEEFKKIFKIKLFD